MRKAGCMCMHPKLYVAGIQYGCRRLRGICGSTRKKLCVRETNPPLSVAFRRGAHDASASGQGQCEDGHKSDNNRCIQHLSYSSMSLLRCFNNLPNVSIDPNVRMWAFSYAFNRGVVSTTLKFSSFVCLKNSSFSTAFLQLFYSFPTEDI